MTNPLTNPMTNPWMSWWSPFPDLTKLMQNISPQTSWFSPTYEVNFAGNREIETDVVSNVASYGTQLSALTKAVLELAKNSSGPNVTWLRELAGQIDERKQKHKSSLEDDLRAKLDDLQETDPARLEKLLRPYTQPH